MTFSTEDVRLRFHQLPTATQVHYVEWESRLAHRRAQLHIEDVLTVGNHSEVIIRISEQFKLPAIDSDPLG